MSVPKLSLTSALARLAQLGEAIVIVGNGAASANLEGVLSFEERPGEVLLRVGCGCHVHVQKDRIRHAVFGEKDFGHGPEGHVQIFDGNYDKVVGLALPGGAEAMHALARELDGNELEIG